MSGNNAAMAAGMKMGAAEKHVLPRKEAVIRGALAGIALAVLTAAAAFASGPGKRDDYGRTQGREIKIYGTVQRVPDGLIGNWDVNGKEITVTRETRIEEKHGKAETGAFVEVEGSYLGKTFKAEEIEVKRARR